MLLIESAGEKKITDEINKADHTYIRGDISQRGPCPGLSESFELEMDTSHTLAFQLLLTDIVIEQMHLPIRDTCMLARSR